MVHIQQQPQDHSEAIHGHTSWPIEALPHARLRLDRECRLQQKVQLRSKPVEDSHPGDADHKTHF